MSIIQGTSKSSAAEYSIDQSIRFNDDDSAHLSRTLGTATNRKIWTYSLWIKRATLGTRQMFFTVAAGGGAQGIIEFDQGDGGNGGMDKLVVNNETSGTTALNWELEIAFRDPAAWYNFIFVYDSTQSTTNDRFKCFVNGTLQTEWDRNSTPGQNEEQAFNNALDHRIGEGHTAANYFDGYMAEINFIDGQALTASSFGETDSSTGQFIPKKYTGSYGNNGFYLKGEDSSDLGNDSSGNGNDFTSSGLTAADQVNDSPTSNHCVLNALNKDTDCTLTDGNLQVGWTSGTDPIICGTMAVSSGKWYYEATFTGTFNFPAVGIAPAELSFGGSAFSSGNGALFYYAPSGNYRGNGDNVSYGADYFVSSKIGVALNLDDNEITFFKDNSSQGTLNLASIRSGYSTWVPLVTGGGSIENIIVNFGQTAFNYTPPTGFKAWSVDNMVDPTIADPSEYFQTALYTTSTSAQDITFSGNSNLAPDWLWFKRRDSASDHFLFDKVRGVLKTISSNDANAEVTSAGSLTAFNSNGFSLGDGGSDNDINGVSSATYAAWAWKANGSGSTDSSAGLTATVSANATAGFSIIKYTGSGSATTVPHGLGVAPKLAIVKDLDNSRSWNVYHDDLSASTKVIFLDQNVVENTDSAIFGSAPTSSVVNIGTGGGSNGSGNDYVMYVFAEIEGYSKISSFVGNGNADGPFVNCGFAPAFILGKRATGSGGHFDWWLFDSERPGFNVTNERITPNNIQATDTGAGSLDILSGGFKIRTNTSSMNNSGDTMIFWAFAESPFKTATAR